MRDRTQASQTRWETKTGRDKRKTRPAQADTASQTRCETSWETRPETRKRQNQGGRTQHPRSRWETSWETRERQNQGGGHSIPDQMGDKLGDKNGDKRKTTTGEADTASQTRWETSWETRPETRERHHQRGGHSIPDQGGHTWETRMRDLNSKLFGEHMGRQNWEHQSPDGRQQQDETGEADTTSQSTPAKMGDKLGDNSKTRLGRQTQHPRPETSWETRPKTGDKRKTSQDGRQVGRQGRRQEEDETRDADTASQPRRTHLRQH